MSIRNLGIGILLLVAASFWGVLFAELLYGEGPRAGEPLTQDVESGVVSFTGSVETSLWAAAHGAGMSGDLLAAFTAIFAWQLDFDRQVNEGDRFRLSVERLVEPGRPPRFGRILAAEYESAGVKHTAVRYQKGDRAGYFRPDGTSLKQRFLRSPLHYQRVSSGFQARRFHPILRINLPHNGIDYAAPTGTPVMAVSSGVVASAEYQSRSGRMVRIEHDAMHATAYLHLSRIASGVSRGKRVDMGQVIGYVGSSGLATGPHLHFELRYGGRVVDPAGMRFPVAPGVPASDLDAFHEVATRELATLPPWAAATTASVPQPLVVGETTEAL